MSSNHFLESGNNSWIPLFGRFSQPIGVEADTFFKHIADSQTNLTNERDALYKEIELLRKEKDEMTKLLKKYNNIVTLNIGNQLFSTTVETLTKEKCLFTKMFNGRFELRDHQGAIFIDRDPTHFRILLNYLRTSTFIEPKSAQDRAELLLEAEYYQISSLIKQLKCETTTAVNMIIVEKLLFDPTLHHPKVVISEGGLRANHSGSCAAFLYAKVSTVSWTNGRHYWEITLESGGSRCLSSMGVATSSWNVNRRLGTDCFSWTLGLYGKHSNYEYTGVRHNGKSSSYYDEFKQGTRVGALLDLNAGTLEYVVDGIKRGVAFTNLKGHVITPVFEFCHQTTFQMNHNAIAPSV